MMKSVIVTILLFIALACVDADVLFKIFPQRTPVYRGRADMIVSPGVYSGHSHRVFGASGFSLGVTGRSYLDVYNDLQASSCTTASISVDKSAYWVPDLFYQFPNGSFTLVPIADHTIYYFGRAGSGNQSNPDYVAFPKGFRMIAGNPFRRSYSGLVPEQAVSFACLGSDGGETNGFPTATRQCINGLRAQVFFPQCWDGVNLDSPSHASHVAYPDQYNTGNCPSTHPVRIPAIFFEVLYSVDQSQFPHGNGQNPFVLACGDPTGYGFHGDFLNGWDINILQAAMKDPSCASANTNNGNIPENCLPLKPYVKTSNPDQSCMLDKPIKNYEDIGLSHWIDHLPGNNPVNFGPAAAPSLTGSYAQTTDPKVKRVLLKSLKTGLFVTARSNAPLTASVAQSDLSYTEIFDFIPFGTNKYGIVTETAVHWVSNNGGGSSPLTGDRGSPSDWEFWNIIYANGATTPTQAGVTGSLLALGNNQYVTVNSNGQLVASSASITGTNEQFLIIDANAGVPDTRTSGSSSTTGSVVTPTNSPPSSTTGSLSPTSSPLPPSSTTIPSLGYIQSKSTGNFVSLSGQSILVNQASVSNANGFFFASVSGGYSIKARSVNLYVTAENGGSTAFTASRTSVGGWETFQIISPSSGYFALVASNGNYVAVQVANTLVATVTVPVGSSIPDSALFRFVLPSLPSLTSIPSISSGAQVKLYSKSTLAYVTVDGLGNLQTLGDSKTLGATFILTSISGGYSLQYSSTNKFVTADGGGSGVLLANRDSASGWETFSFTARSGSTYTITAGANNQLVSALNNAVWYQLSPTVANSGTIPDSALFYILSA